jgi:hypothetical protein
VEEAPDGGIDGSTLKNPSKPTEKRQWRSQVTEVLRGPDAQVIGYSRRKMGSLILIFHATDCMTSAPKGADLRVSTPSCESNTSKNGGFDWVESCSEEANTSVADDERVSTSRSREASFRRATTA